jgi:hypothetical protein
MTAAVGFGTGRPAASAKYFFVPFPKSIITDTDVTTLQENNKTSILGLQVNKTANNSIIFNLMRNDQQFMWSSL